MTDPSHPATRAKITAATVEAERARIYGAARNIAEQANLNAALMVLDAIKLRLVRAYHDKGGWIG